MVSGVGRKRSNRSIAFFFLWLQETMNNYLVLSENPSKSLGLDGAREEFVHDEQVNPGMMMATYPDISTVNVGELLKRKPYLISNSLVFYGKDMARYVVPIFWEMVGSNMPPCFVYHGNDLLNSQLPFTFPPSPVVLRLHPPTSPMDPTANTEWVQEVVDGRAEVARDDQALSEWMQRQPTLPKQKYKCPDNTNVHRNVNKLQKKICKFFTYPDLFPASDR